MNGAQTTESKETKEELSQRIEAFCALEFPDFTFYVKTRSVIIGRRPPLPALEPSPEPSLGAFRLVKTPSIGDPSTTYLSPRLGPVISNTRSTSPSNFGGEEDVFSDVEPTVAPSSILINPSNLESTIPPLPAPVKGPSTIVDVDLGPIKAVSRDHARLYFSLEVGCWCLEVRGRNGVVVENKWRARGENVALRNRSKIQISERIFHFVLPENARNGKRANGNNQDTASEAWSSDGEVSVSSEDLESTVSELPAAVPLLLPHKRLGFIPSRRGRPPLPPPEPRISNRQRRLPTKLVGDYKFSEDVPLPVEPIPEPLYEPVEPESADGAASSDDAFVTRGEKKPPGTKKTPRKSKSEPKTKPRKPRKTVDSDERPGPSLDLGTEPPGQTPARPRAPNGEINEHVGRADKPPYSFAALVAQAIYHNHPTKLSSAAICDWVAAHYPWFAVNKDKVAWQNSIQQNLTVHSIFLKIPRGTDEPGKGNFWLMDPVLSATFDGVNFSVQPAKRSSTYKAAAAAHRQSGASSARRKVTDSAKKAAAKATKVEQPGMTLLTQSDENAVQAQETDVAMKREGETAVAPSTEEPLQPVVVKAAPKPKPAAKAVDAKPTQPVEIAPLPLKITVGPIPDDYKPPAAAQEAAQSATDKTEDKALPMIVYNDGLILSPAIFGHLKPEQLESLSKLGASKALGVLQSFIVQFYKEKLRKKAALEAREKAAKADAGPLSDANGTTKRKASEGPATEEPAAKKVTVSG